MDKQINFLLHIKLNSLKRDGLDSLTFKQLKRVIYETKWLLAIPHSVSEIAKDINDLTINEVAKYLTVNDQALVKGMKELNDAFEANSLEEPELEDVDLDI